MTDSAQVPGAVVNVWRFPEASAACAICPSAVPSPPAFLTSLSASAAFLTFPRISRHSLPSFPARSSIV